MFLLHVAAAAALLIWSVRLVRTGVERAFAHALRQWLRRMSEGRVRAAATGLAAALLLQSSTAVALFLAAFLESGALLPAVGLAALLGADVGSALVAQLLILRPEWITPLLLLLGVGLFLRGTGHRARQVGRILVGIALIFVSLDLIAEAAGLLPLSMLGAVGDYMSRDLATAFLLLAILAWAMHSSVAAVLLVATLAEAGALGGAAAVAMVLGANLGGSVIPVLLTHGASGSARSVVIANFAVRGGCAALALWALGAGILVPGTFGPTAAVQAMTAHVVFNLALVVLALPFAGFLVRIARLVIREADEPADIDISALDPAALRQPRRALGCARREILRMGEEIEAMLRAILPLYDRWDDAAAEEILLREARIDRMHFHTKLYLSRLMRESGDADAIEPAADLAALAAQLEAAGDEISSTMLAMARRLHADMRRFSDEGWTELVDFHDRVMANTRQALEVIMHPEVDTARALVAEKDALRRVEERLQVSHLSRLRKGLSDSVETSNIHQQTLRCLKQVNSAFATAAHPILKDAGEILSSRLARHTPPDRAAS
jgi:phosphate:Na+ symporter